MKHRQQAYQCGTGSFELCGRRALNFVINLNCVDWSNLHLHCIVLNLGDGSCYLVKLNEFVDSFNCWPELF